MLNWSKYEKSELMRTSFWMFSSFFQIHYIGERKKRFRSTIILGQESGSIRGFFSNKLCSWCRKMCVPFVMQTRHKTEQPCDKVPPPQEWLRSHSIEPIRGHQPFLRDPPSCRYNTIDQCVKRWTLCAQLHASCSTPHISSVMCQRSHVSNNTLNAHKMAVMRSHSLHLCPWK